MIAPLLPRALCQAGIVSSCVSWLSRIPIGSGKAGLVLPAAGGLGTHWDGGERRRSWQQLGPSRGGEAGGDISSVS